MTEPLIWREPDVFAIGDSLIFQRNLPDYPPSQNWSILYTLTPQDPPGSAAALQFASTPDATSTYHQVNIANFGNGLTAGVYVLSGYLQNTNGERHQAYYGELQLTPNLPAGQSTGSLKTFNERMVEECREKCLRLAKIDLTKTSVQRTEFEIEQRKQAREELAIWEYRVMNDNKLKQIANTGRDPSLVTPLYAGGW